MKFLEISYTKVPFNLVRSLLHLGSLVSRATLLLPSNKKIHLIHKSYLKSLLANHKGHNFRDVYDRGWIKPSTADSVGIYRPLFQFFL